MGLDVKKILDDINPSDKVMKWIIVLLVASVATIFGWGIKRGKHINDLDSLKQDYKELAIKVEKLEKATPKVVESEVTNGMNQVKVIVFKEINDLENELTDKITLIVSSQGEVTKEWLLKAIDIRERSNRTLSLMNSVGEVKNLSFDAYSSEPLLAQAPSNNSLENNTVYSEFLGEEEVDVEDATSTVNNIESTDSIEQDTAKKKFFLVRIFKKN